MTTKQVQITCSECGADEMTLDVVTEGDERTTTLSCPCGRSTWEESYRRETVTAILCGPGAGGSTVVGKIWAPKR